MESTSSDFYNKILLSLLKDETFIKNQQILYHPNSNKTAVIIDPRYDDLMEAVIRNFMFFMNPQGWNLYIISHSSYEQAIKEKFPNASFSPIAEQCITYDNNNIPNITINIYNNLLLSEELWNMMPSENIAIFQKDCIMYKMFNDYFTFYDFAGANYGISKVITNNNNTHTYADNRTIFGVGMNGGFSLRHKSAMLNCLKNIKLDDIELYRKILLELLKIENPQILKIEDNEYTITRDIVNHNEDVYFTHACEMLTYNMPDELHILFLAMESQYSEAACVYHGWNKNYHSLDQAKNIIKMSPFLSKYA